MPKQIKNFSAGAGLWVQTFFQQKLSTKLWVKSYLVAVTGPVRNGGDYVSPVWRSSKSTRHRRSENKYYLQFSSGNGFYLHSSKWFVAHWGMDLLNLSLVSPEAGEPWPVNAAHGVGREARKHSCRKVLPRLGRLDTGVKQNSHDRFSPEQLWSFFLSTWTNLPILYYYSGVASSLGKKHSCPCFCFLCSLWGMEEMWVFL